MELLERYLLQIRRYLPLKERDETIEELRSLLLDQLDKQDDADKENAMRQIIIDMGDPHDVAMRYNDRGPIISKEMEPIMLLVMKIVSITLPLVILFADSLAYVTEADNPDGYGFVLNLIYMIPGALYSLIVAIGMIFIVFALIERYVQPKIPVDDRPFNPDLMPDLPQKEFKVNSLGTVIEILVNILVLYLANNHLSLLAVYVNGERTPIFNDNIQPYIILLSVSWIATIILRVFYLYLQRKSIPTRTVEFIINIYGAILLILIGQANVFNDLIINGDDFTIVTNIFQIILIIVGVAIIIGSVVEYIKMFININKLDTINNTKK